MIYLKKAMTDRTWVVKKAIPQTAWSKPNSPWSYVLQGWVRPITVHSTSGRTYGWLGLWRKCIMALYVGRNFSHSFKMDSCTGRLWLQIFWQHSRTGCHGKHWIILTWFGDSGLQHLWRNVHGIFCSQGKWHGKAQSLWWQSWERMLANRRKVTSQSCVRHYSWL